MMEAITGMSREEYTNLFSASGESDHVVPLCAFDLTNPEHVVRAAYHTNVRIIPVRNNQIKGKAIPEGLDIMSLPWSKNPAAIDLAQAFIARQLARLNAGKV
jgi:hypothetical protein